VIGNHSLLRQRQDLIDNAKTMSFYPQDCGNLADCARCVQETIKAFGGIDILIGNAGWTRFSAFDDLDAASEEDWDRCWAVNVKGQM